MKSYSCKICLKRGKNFSGNRQMVRKHLREEHLIKGKRTLSFKAEERYRPSDLTKNTVVVRI